MIGKIFSHLLWGTDELIEAAGVTMEELKGFEEEGWIIVNLPGQSNDHHDSDDSDDDVDYYEGGSGGNNIGGDDVVPVIQRTS